MNPVKQVPVIHVGNEQGAIFINQLLNLALKGGGLDALNVVNQTIQAINRPPQIPLGLKPKPEPEPEDEGKIIPIRPVEEK